jgi:hypothetical protein
MHRPAILNRRRLATAFWIEACKKKKKKTGAALGLALGIEPVRWRFSFVH